MTKARTFRSGTDRAGHPTFFIDSKRVSKERFHESQRKSLEIRAHPRTKRGVLQSVPLPLRAQPRPLVRHARVATHRRFVARIRARPNVGRVGDEYSIVTLEIEADHAPTDDEWFAFSNAAYPDLTAFFVKDSREV